MDNANRTTSVLNHSKQEVNVVNVVNVAEHAMAQAHPTRPLLLDHGLSAPRSRIGQSSLIPVRLIAMAQLGALIEIVAATSAEFWAYGS